MTGSLDAFSPATAMLDALDRRSVSAVELLDLHIRQMDRYNSALNAIIIKDLDRAREAASAADARRSRGESAPLLGLPITVKDAIDVAGLPTTCGVPERANAVAADDAPIVASLRAAGAVIFGKSNVPPNAADWQAANPLFGRTNNPWDLERTPGGSTGGGAAAIAVGMSPLEPGSDIGGSIRYPAAWSGIFGHRPSATAIPRSGHFPPPSRLPNSALSLNTLGPLARTAEDLDLAMSVMGGAEPGEDVAWRLQLPAPRHERLADFRVATLGAADWRPVDPEIRAALDHAAARLRSLGATVQDALPPELGDLREHHELFQRILAATSASFLSPEERSQRAATLRASSDPWAELRARAVEASAADYIMWHVRREELRLAWRQFFRDWDVLLAPIVIVPAPLHTTVPPEDRVVEIDGRTVSHRVQGVYSGLSILCGQPATAFPIGLTRSGLPIGVQAIGPYLEDRTAIRFGGLLNRELGGIGRPPGFNLG
ncbi:MAG: amidase [Chloroflexota bacterium]